jgi:hypothetical protein
MYWKNALLELFLLLNISIYTQHKCLVYNLRTREITSIKEMHAVASCRILSLHKKRKILTSKTDETGDSKCRMHAHKITATGGKIIPFYFY